MNMDLYYIVNEYQVKYCKLNTAGSRALGQIMHISQYIIHYMNIDLVNSIRSTISRRFTSFQNIS